MACRRCSIHHIKYPFTLTKEGGGCPVDGCEHPQESHPHLDPDPNWQQMVTNVNFSLLGGYPAEPREPMILDPWKIGPPPSYWVTPGELERCGYTFGRHKEFPLIRTQGLYYEVQGWNARRGAYWVELVDPVTVMASVPVVDDESA